MFDINKIDRNIELFIFDIYIAIKRLIKFQKNLTLIFVLGSLKELDKEKTNNDCGIV